MKCITYFDFFFAECFFYRDLQSTAIATLFVSQHDRVFARFFARMCIDLVTS